MTINTTLDSFLYANTTGFAPDYGKITTRPSGSLISREINQNMEKLISIGHSIAITENSETTAIEYNASFVIKTEDATLKLGTAFQGCQVTIVLAENGFIEYTKAEGNTKEKYKKNTIKKITYNGLYWIDTTPLQIPETNLTCDTAAEEEFKIVKIETILQQGKIPNNIELNIDFTNANSFGETTAATPTYPKLKITNAADEELGIYTICDSRGHYAGKGCWNSGDTMTFKIKGTKACITNSDVRETTSDYTIYSDGSNIHRINTQTNVYTTSLSQVMKKISLKQNCVYLIEAYSYSLSSTSIRLDYEFKQRNVATLTQDFAGGYMSLRRVFFVDKAQDASVRFEFKDTTEKSVTITITEINAFN